MKKIPESFIDIANKHDLPLIEIPTDINFSEITRAILEQIVNKQTYLLEQSEKIHYELTNLILNDQNLSEVTNHLARLTSANIIIYNEFYSIIHSNVHAVQSKNSSQTSFSFHEQSIDLLNDLLRSREKESKVHVTFEQYVFTIYPIIAKQACFGWIVLLKPKEKWQELDDIAIERAAPIYAMEFLKKQAIEETQLRIQNNLLEDIFNNNYLNEQLIIDQALKMDYVLSVPQCVFHCGGARVGIRARTHGRASSGPSARAPWNRPVPRRGPAVPEWFRLRRLRGRRRLRPEARYCRRR